MGLYLKYIVGVLHLLLLSTTSSVTVYETWSLQNVRVKRQEGYVYDRPSVSFDLPTQPTTAATQPPVIQRTQTPADRTQSQYMYYAYPAPTGRDTVNIGYSTVNAAATSGAGGGGGSGGGAAGGGNGGADGYNYGTQNSGTSATQTASTGSPSGGAGGYNYGVQNSGPSATQTASTGSSSGGAGGYNYGVQNSGSPAIQTASTGSSSGAAGGYNYGTQNSGTSATQTASAGSGYSGYSSNTGTPLGVNQSPTTASTNAPKYLPPVSSGGVSSGVNTGLTVNIPSGPASSPAPIISPTEGSQSGISVSDSGYLPPLLSPSSPTGPQPGYTPSSSPKPVTETPSGYLPPSVSTPGSLPTQITVSTPASTYLPPVF